MMKFLYGLVLLVATLPLSAANPTTVGFAVFINPVVVDSNEHDCTDYFMAEVWPALEDAAVGVSDVYAGKIVPVQSGSRELRGDHWREQRELWSCPSPCHVEFCCIAFWMCGCNACGEDCNRRRDLEFLESETRLLEHSPEALTVLDEAFLPILKGLAEENDCLGHPNQITVTVMH